MPRILESNNYSKFVQSDFNREVTSTWRLEQSLLKYGWWDEEPMPVVRLEEGKLRIEDGHRRFYAARKHGIPVKYVEISRDRPRPTQADRDGTHKPWSLNDYLRSFAKNNIKAYMAVYEYHQRSGIKLNACISMMSGSSAGSGNWRKQFKEGTYRLGDSAHALLVEKLVAHCRKHEFRHWNDTPFVNALSKIAWAEVFDSAVLMSKITTFPELLKKHGTREEYILMLEGVYNRYSKELVPLAVKAEEAARKRNVVSKRAEESAKKKAQPSAHPAM